MEQKNDPIFNEIIRVCEQQRVKDLMGFRYDWNREIIAQFYTTVHFGYKDGERVMLWMSNGVKYGIRFTRFLALFNIDPQDKDYPKLHDDGLVEPEAVCFMYPRAQEFVDVKQYRSSEKSFRTDHSSVKV